MEFLKNNGAYFATKSEVYRRAIGHFITHFPFDQVSNIQDLDEKGLMRHLASLIEDHEERMFRRVGNLTDSIGDLRFLVQQISDPTAVERSNYLAMITKSLFDDHLEETLRTHDVAKLIPLLQHSFLSEYLGDWIHMMANRQPSILQIDSRNRIIWNEGKIHEIYD